MAEAGVPGVVATAWFGIQAPKGTPKAIVERLHAETVKAIFEKPIIPIANRVPEVPIRVSAVIETALAKQPELRWRLTPGRLDRSVLRSGRQTLPPDPRRVQ